MTFKDFCKLEHIQELQEESKKQKFLNILMGGKPQLLGPFDSEEDAKAIRPEGKVRPDKRKFPKNFRRFVPHGNSFYGLQREDVAKLLHKNFWLSPSGEFIWASEKDGNYSFYVGHETAARNYLKSKHIPIPKEDITLPWSPAGGLLQRQKWVRGLWEYNNLEIDGFTLTAKQKEALEDIGLEFNAKVIFNPFEFIEKPLDPKWRLPSKWECIHKTPVVIFKPLGSK